MLHMRGPQFLALFSVLAIGAYLALGYFIAAREWQRSPGKKHIRDPYEIAFLRGGLPTLVQVAALTLTLRGLLKFDTSTLATANGSDVDRVAAPIEKALLKACLTPTKPSVVAAHSDVTAAGMAYERDLQARHLLADSEARHARRGPVLTAIAFLCVIAGAKVFVALATGHSNVGFLISLTVLAGLLIAKKITARRTAAGDAALNDLSNLFSILKHRGRSSTSANRVADAAMMAAVYGIYQLPDHGVSSWSKLFSKPVTTSSSCSSGGSSCGGGGGCGGGGCGGCGS